MGLIGHAAPGVDAAVAKFIVGPLTFLVALLAFTMGIRTGNAQIAIAGIVVALAGLIPWTRTRENVMSITGIALHVLYFLVLIFAAGIYATAA